MIVEEADSEVRRAEILEELKEVALDRWSRWDETEDYFTDTNYVAKLYKFGDGKVPVALIKWRCDGLTEE